MSELPQRTDPDLHAIFGIDGEPDDRSADHVISVERAARGDPDIHTEPLPGVEDRIDVEPAAIPGAEIELDSLQDAAAEVELGTIVDADTYVAEEHGTRAEQAARGVQFSGITKPSGRGSSQRFLTDVIVDLGLTSRKQVEDALESFPHIGHHARARAARERGAHAGRAGARAGRALRARSPGPRRLLGRHGGRQPREHGRGQALPDGAGGLRGQAHAAGGDGRPVERARGGRHRDHDRIRDPRRGRPPG